MNAIKSFLLLMLTVALLAGCGHSRVVRRDGSSASASSRSGGLASQPPPRDGVYRVKSGDTLYGIASRFGLKLRDVAAWNRLVDPYLIRVGQRLLLRPPRGTSEARSTGPTTPQTAATRPPATDPNDALAAATMPRWHWPTQGDIVGRYVLGDPTRQGIDIAGDSGQPIAAAADGLVVYSGAGLVGYGELIIVKHSEQWLSAYAHNRRRLVAEGVRVKSGETIAEMGRSGATRDMLHFEIRRNGKPVDPLALLPSHR